MLGLGLKWLFARTGPSQAGDDSERDGAGVGLAFYLGFAQQMLSVSFVCNPRLEGGKKNEKNKKINVLGSASSLDLASCTATSCPSLTPLHLFNLYFSTFVLSKVCQDGGEWGFQPNPIPFYIWGLFLVSPWAPKDLLKASSIWI